MNFQPATQYTSSRTTDRQTDRRTDSRQCHANSRSYCVQQYDLEIWRICCNRIINSVETFSTVYSIHSTLPRSHRTSYSRPRKLAEGLLRAGHRSKSLGDRSVSVQLSPSVAGVWSALCCRGGWSPVGEALITARLVPSSVRSTDVVSSGGDNRCDNLISAGAVELKTTGKTVPQYRRAAIDNSVTRSGQTLMHEM